MKFTPPGHWFGLMSPADVDVVAAWGARTILEGPPHTQRVDILLDRINVYPADRDLPKPLQNWILLHVRPWLRNKCHRAYIDPGCDAVFATSVVTHDGVFIAQASPRKSHGYLYVVAWLEPPPQAEPGIAEHTEPSNCPNCGAELTHSVAMDGNLPSPKPGQITTCSTCSVALIVDEGLRVRFPAPGELEEKLKDDPYMQDALRDAERFVGSRSAARPASKPTPRKS